MMRGLIFFVAALMPVSALAEPWSQEYGKGWCAGYSQAVEHVQQNQAHLRALIGPSVDSATEVGKTVRIMLDGVAGFVMLVPVKDMEVFFPGFSIDCRTGISVKR